MPRRGLAQRLDRVLQRPVGRRRVGHEQRERGPPELSPPVHLLQQHGRRGSAVRDDQRVVHHPARCQGDARGSRAADGAQRAVARSHARDRRRGPGGGGNGGGARRGNARAAPGARAARRRRAPREIREPGGRHDPRGRRDHGCDDDGRGEHMRAGRLAKTGAAGAGADTAARGGATTAGTAAGDVAGAGAATAGVAMAGAGAAGRGAVTAGAGPRRCSTPRGAPARGARAVRSRPPRSRPRARSGLARARPGRGASPARARARRAHPRRGAGPRGSAPAAATRRTGGAAGEPEQAERAAEEAEGRPAAGMWVRTRVSIAVRGTVNGSISSLASPLVVTVPSAAIATTRWITTGG